jgi:hypothetical protein
MEVLGRHVSWASLLVCGLVILAAALALGFFGFGVAPWIILAGACCVLMMGSMVWMMVAMGRNAIHRH